MSIKSIMCVFNGEANELNALGIAFNLTRQNSASLRVVHVAAPPILYEGVIATGFAPPAGDGSVMTMLEKEAHDLAEAAAAYVADFTKTHVVPLQPDGGKAVFGQAHASFRPVIGPAAGCLASEGRTVDLIVTGYDKAGDLTTLVSLLFKTGAPVLAIPHLPGGTMSVTGHAETIAVAWDGSITAARALRAAMPELLNARDVYLVSVEGMDDPVDVTGEADVRNYLTSHGVVAEFIHCERTSHPIGFTVLEKARDLGADLLVMGAYGRGHVGEMLLGGVSNYVVKHTHLPLLLAH